MATQKYKVKVISVGSEEERQRALRKAARYLINVMKENLGLDLADEKELQGVANCEYGSDLLAGVNRRSG